MTLKTDYKIRELIRLSRREKWPLEAVQGDGNGTIDVPGQDDLCYVRPEGMSLPIIVKSGDAPSIQNYPVWVGRDVYDKKTIRVLSRRTKPGVSLPGGVGLHGSSHYITGGDPITIDASQVVNALVYAKTGMVVHVNAGVINFDGQPTGIASQDITLTTNIPSSTGAIWALVVADDTGVITVDDSMTPLDSVTLLTRFNMPPAPVGKRALAGVRLYYGQTALSRIAASPDVVPLHLMPDCYGGPAAMTLQAIATIEGVLDTGLSTIRIPNHSGAARTITSVFLDINTAPTGQALILDVHKSGTTIFTDQAHRPQIADGAYSGYSSSIDVATWADGEYLQIQPDQLGSSVVGSDLTVSIVYTT